MEFLWILGTAIIFATILMVAYHHNGQSALILVLGFLVEWILISILSGKLIRRWQKRRKTVCKKCRKSWALERINRKIVKKEEIVLPVELQYQGTDNSLEKWDTQYIPAVRISYEDTYKCKFCGNVEIRSGMEEQKKL